MYHVTEIYSYAQCLSHFLFSACDCFNIYNFIGAEKA